MNCPECAAPNPEQNKYCGACGVRLTHDGGITDADLRRRVEAIINERPKDPKLIEVELTEAVVGRISNWAKLLGYFAGIPLGALILVVGVLGFKKYTDLQALADRVDQLRPLVDKAQGELKDLEPRMTKIRADSDRFDQYDKEFDGRFAVLSKSLDAKVASITNDVQQITEAVSKPAVFRWSVRTGTDPDARLVASPEAPVQTTVEALIALPRPSEMPSTTRQYPAFQEKRARPVEFTVYSVDATLTALKHEVSGDYHLVLQGASGSTMIANSPNPDPSFVNPSSRWVNEIAAVRKEIDRKIPGGKVTPVRVRIAGIGFWDFVHGQTGVAPNGIELHPVTNIKFLE
jgi:hypothetical protein